MEKPAEFTDELWAQCYISEDDQIFTPSFDPEGTMTATGRETYNAWLAGLSQPKSNTPTLEQRTAALENAMLAVMGGDGNV